MDSFFSSFCKVEFVCYEGEPNWLGWLILIPFFLLVFWLLLNTLVVTNLKVNDWFDEIKSESEKENSTFRDKVKHFFGIILFLVYCILFFGIIIFTFNKFVLSPILNFYLNSS